MASGLGDANVTATIAGATSQYAGRWVAAFTPAVIGIFQAQFECYRIVIRGGPPASTFDVYIGTRLYDSVTPGDTNSWDPNQTLKLNQGDTVTFVWNSGAGAAGPEVWLYFQAPAVLT
jgi:hypothetical protein